MKTDDLLFACEALLTSLDVRGATGRGIAVALGLGELRHVGSGDTIFSEGDRSEAMAVLVRGEVEVWLNDVHGSARQLSVIEAPAIIGEAGIVDRSPRSASCRASSVKSAELIEISRATLGLILEREDEVGASVRRLMAASMIRHLERASESHVQTPATRKRDVLPPLPPRQPDRDALAETISDWRVPHPHDKKS